METLYTGNIHGFSPTGNASDKSLNVAWGSQEGLIALGVVLGSSISLVGLAFAFITYSLFSDLRSLAGTALLSLLASLFMGQLLFVIGVGGVQDTELCLSISLALLFMKLASLCWLCACCHHTFILFRSNVNLIPRPEPKMGMILARYSLFCWGFPLIMVFVAAAFEYREKEYNKIHQNNKQQISSRINLNEFNTSNNCWLMTGSAYFWGFLTPSIVLIFISCYLAYQAKITVNLSISMQNDPRMKSKLAKRRFLQIRLFDRLLKLYAIIILLGASASIWNSKEFWAIYSIAQGIQGISTTLLVTCNCKILKLYTIPRIQRSRKGKYNGLEDGEGGHFGVLSITNPNYNPENDEECLTQPQTTQIDDDSSFVKMNYNADILKERHEYPENTNTLNCDLINSLPTCELLKEPLPQSV